MSCYRACARAGLREETRIACTTERVCVGDRHLLLRGKHAALKEGCETWGSIKPPICCAKRLC